MRLIRVWIKRISIPIYLLGLVFALVIFAEPKEAYAVTNNAIDFYNNIGGTNKKVVTWQDDAFYYVQKQRWQRMELDLDLKH
jgi:hypothetical protein